MKRLLNVSALAVLAFFNASVAQSQVKLSEVNEETHFITHQVPDCPFFIDGSEAEPEAILKYNGMPLVYLMDPVAQRMGKDVLYVFTSEAKAQAYIKAVIDPLLNALQPPVSAARERGLTLYEHAGFLGSSFTFPVGVTINDLRQFRLSGSSLNWNDRASSLINSDKWAWAYEHIYQAGNIYPVAPYARVSYLGQYWNDRFSSLSVSR
jgi:hypothetical protein